MTDETIPRLGSVEYDPTTDAYYTNYAQDVAPPSAVVPQAMAEVTGRAAENLRPLHEVVDPDALDQLLAEGASSARGSRFRSPTPATTCP